MITNERELNVLKAMYRLSLPDVAEDALDYFYQLDKLNANNDDWHQLSAHIHRLGISCQMFEFDMLCQQCFELEFILDRELALFHIENLGEIEERLIQIKHLAQVTSIESPISAIQ
ncbi:MAG: Hpt domain-containing protein [Sinobacterium sp.]|nr:Hpt domain-containing protein [Sinobacterium sp.]